MVAPTTMTPTGPQAMRGGNADIWAMNNEGYLMRMHKRLGKALFTPFSTGCPIPVDQADNTRTIITWQPGAPQRVITDGFQSLGKRDQKRILEGQAWIGGIWFKSNPAATAVTTAPAVTPMQIQQQHATPAGPAQVRTTRSAQPTSQVIRATGRQAQRGATIPPLTSSRRAMTIGYLSISIYLCLYGLYIYKKQGRFWKRVHIKQRTALYVPTQRDGGPDPDNLLPTGTATVHPADGSRPQRFEDQWASEPTPTQLIPWKGSTDFEEKTEYKEQMELDDEEVQPARKAKGGTALQMPTPQQVQEHNLMHLPHTRWCPICAQCKGRATNHPTQKSKQPVIHVDFAFLKTNFGPKVTPLLSAVDMQTGLRMAALIPDKQELFECAVSCLQSFIIECGRTETIFQSNNEEYLVQLLKAVANDTGKMAVRHSPAYSSQSQGAVESLHRAIFWVTACTPRTPSTRLRRCFDNKNSHHRMDG